MNLSDALLSTCLPGRMTERIEPQTRRLRLRQWIPADREPFAALDADPRVMQYFPATLTREESDAIPRRCQMLIEEGGWGFWAVEPKTTNEFIGFVGLHTPSAELPFYPCVEVGWRLAFRHWGKGYATEAAKAAVRVGFDLLGLKEVVAFTAAGNLRSRAVMERLAMRQSDAFEHPQVPRGSGLERHCLYRLPSLVQELH